MIHDNDTPRTGVDVWTHYELGELPMGSMCRLTLHPVAESGPIDLMTTGATLDVQRGDDGSVSATIPTDSTGPRSSKLTVSQGDSTIRHYSITAQVRGAQPVPYPAPMGVHDARTVLRHWAAKHPLVPDTLFDGALRVRDASVVLARVVTQSASVEMVTNTAPALPELRVLSEGTGLDADQSHWTDAAATMIINDSITRIACKTCDHAHRIPCVACAATGALDCAASISCPDCDGKGTKWSSRKILTAGARLARTGFEAYQAINEGRTVSALGGVVGAAETLSDSASDSEGFHQMCSRCEGTGTVACPECAGEGRKDCPNCIEGRMACTDCGGDGEQVRFTTVTAKHTIDTSDKLSGDDGLSRRFRAHRRPLHVPARGQDGELARHHTELAQWVAQQATARGNSEVVRRMWLEVIPITAVDYTEARIARTAYLVGPQDHPVIYAPKAATPDPVRARMTLNALADRGRRILHRPDRHRAPQETIFGHRRDPR